MKKISLFFVIVLIVAIFCACEAGEQQSTLSPEAKNTIAAEQVHVTFCNSNTDAIYSVIMEPNLSAIIGRKDTSDIVIADEHVSRTHCKITLIDGRLFVEDMDSTNGTFLMKDGEAVKVIESTEIKEGDILVLADVYLTLESIKQSK